jgi:hypothetical protein
MCAVDTLQLSFERGRFTVQVQPVTNLTYSLKEQATS